MDKSAVSIDFSHKIKYDSAMKRNDTTDPRAHSNVLTVLNGAYTEREAHLAGKFRIHMLGLYFAQVGPEWGSDGHQQGDYVHHLDISLSGRRQVVAHGEVFNLEPGQVWFLPGNTPVERRCNENCEVLFFKLASEWLPGVDPLLDWSERGPRLAGQCSPAECRGWLEAGRAFSMADLLNLRGRLGSWIACAVPELGDIIASHLKTQTQFTAVFETIERMLGADLRMSCLSEAYGTSDHAFSMAFTRGTGISPKEYLKRRLNQESLKWVINTDLQIKEIAEKLRFSDEFYFSRFFKQLNGCSPKLYRQRFHRR